MSWHLLLIAVGVVGALTDVALHFLQLIGREIASAKVVSIITLAGCLLWGLSLIAEFNLGTALVTAIVAAMSVYALITGKECH